MHCHTTTCYRCCPCNKLGSHLSQINKAQQLQVEIKGRIKKFISAIRHELELFVTYTFTTFLVSIRDLGQCVLGCDLVVHNIGAIRHNAGNGKGALDLVDRYFVLEDELGDEGYSAPK